MDWYWRMRMGFPPRSEDREALRRIAPELFGRDWEITVEPTSDQHPIWGRPFQREIKLWLGTLDDRPSVTVHEGACPQYDCPLRLGRRSGQVMGGQTSGDDAHPGGEVVLELMTVAGGWSAKAKTFFDMARKVHGGNRPIDCNGNDGDLFSAIARSDVPNIVAKFGWRGRRPGLPCGVDYSTLVIFHVDKLMSRR